LNGLKRYAVFIWPAVIVLSAVLAALMMLIPEPSPLRAAAAFWFLLVCPGMAFVRLLRLHDTLVEVSLAIALSIAIDIIVSETLVVSNSWSPGWALAIIVLVSLVGVALQLRQAGLPAVGVLK